MISYPADRPVSSILLKVYALRNTIIVQYVMQIECRKHENKDQV